MAFTWSKGKGYNPHADAPSGADSESAEDEGMREDAREDANEGEAEEGRRLVRGRRMCRMVRGKMVRQVRTK